MAIEPLKYGEYFYELYTTNCENRKILFDCKSKLNKRKRNERRCENLQNDQLYPSYSLAQIELEPNSSKFSVYSSIRAAVLEAETKFALFQENSKKRPNFLINRLLTCCFICAGTCKQNQLLECSCHKAILNNEKALKIREAAGGNVSDIESGSEDAEEEVVPKVPLIVGVGLKSLFELIADAKNIQPALCTKALKALLDVVQGQNLESFKNEPEDLISSLYDLLLDLATLHGPMDSTQQLASSSVPATNWSSVACSALMSLCIARGDTGKILKAIAATMMSSKFLSSQVIILPQILFSLQRTVIAAALNKPVKPDFHTYGVPKNSLVDQFSLQNALSSFTNCTVQPTMTSDGTYLYLLVSNCLMKIGTGFNGSFKGHIYSMNTEFGKDRTGWLGYCNGKLYYKRLSKKNIESFVIVSTDSSLSITSQSSMNAPVTREGQNYVLFSDEDSVNAICTNRDDTLIVKQIYNSRQQSGFELPLKLARKKFRTLGYAAFEDEVLNQNQIQKIQSSYNIFEPKLPNDVEIQSIVCGKEFGIVRGSNGKIYYYGKPSSLGLKPAGRPTMKMTELIVSKVSNIMQIAVGHDGIHALLVNDDGTVYFTGTARRGEDGDSSKNRRQPKAVKPKKLSKIDGHIIVQTACNNGTSAFVTKTGKLIMFGKDTAHCDSLGFVTDLLDQHITKVALGKAHCVALNSKGQLFSFGLNNKGQCGRKLSKEKESNFSDCSLDQKFGGKANNQLDFSTMCDFDDHFLVQGQCRVCAYCKECTGYNISCVSSLNIPVEERIPGAICACGHGDAGCSKCGACSSCVSMQETDSESKCLKPSNLLNRQRSKVIIIRKKDSNKKLLEENQPSDIERDTPRVAPLSPARVTLPTSSPVVQIACGLHHTVALTLEGEVFTFGSNQYGQLGTGDLLPIQGPVQVKVQGVISQVAAGSNHTVLLTLKGMVYTVGNYQKGQLGRLPSEIPKTSLNEDGEKNNENSAKELTAASVIAQRQKFLWNCTPGAVFGLGQSFGKKATWIGASGDQTFIKIDESLITTQMLPKVNIVANQSTILLIPTIPLSFNALTINRRDGSCNAHCKNQVNFVQMIQSNPNALPEINQNIDPNSLLAVHHQQDQMSRSMHEARNQVFEQENADLKKKWRQQSDLSPSEKFQPQIAFALDPCFNVLWVFDGGCKKIFCFNVIASEISETNRNASNFRAILSPELSLSQNKEAHISRSQASLNLLACLDILTSASDSIPGCFEQLIPEETSQIIESQSTEYQTVNRFDHFGGGWGYSGRSVEAIRFAADTDIMICGFGMFGGRGEYSCKIKLFDLGTDINFEKDGVLITETKETPYECAARGKYHIMLPKPVSINANRWYLILARIAGPSSDCGSSGQASVTTDDQIVFTFKSSKKANNGTDVNCGQIPEIIYHLITQNTRNPQLSIDSDPIQKISRSFANTVTKECFESLVILLNWSWDTFKLNLREQKDKSKQIKIKSNLEHLVYVNKSCLRLLRKYTNEIYPHTIHIPKNNANSKKNNEIINTQTYITGTKSHSSKLFIGDLPTTSKKANMENVQLAECIGNVRALLILILCDDLFKDVQTEEAHDMLTDILQECHASFVACFDAFYPTASLKWNCLCDLLSQMDKGVLHARLLSAIIAGLCSPSVKLRETFSLLSPGSERQSIVSPSDNSGLPMLSSSESHQYPILVEQMIYRTQQEKNDFLSNTWTFKDVLLRLLDIISNPVKAKIENIYNRSVVVVNFDDSQRYGKDSNQGLIENSCHLLARVLAEIVYQSSMNENDALYMPPKSLHSTGSRFARCDVSRTWNTGNFGPDAIGFSVDRSVAIAGAMVYSGSGNYDYQLELLFDNTSDTLLHKWETLESVSGSYDQSSVQNNIAEIKFERLVHIKENGRYALRLCSQGARTCSGDGGLPSVRGPCGTTFSFHCCDLSFNGTTPTRGQLPCILYYNTSSKNDGNNVECANEITSRDTALQIATDITKKCSELLILARNALAASLSPSDKSPISSNHTQTVDSEHNITPIEEHMDINWAHNSRNSTVIQHQQHPHLEFSAARDITKRIESFSKGIMETLKFDKRSSANNIFDDNPFDDFEIEIGATEINPSDLIEEVEVSDRLRFKHGGARNSKYNGNSDRIDNDDINAVVREMSKSDSDDSTQITLVQILELFNINTSNMFHTLLPLVYAHIGTLACSDPKSSVQILGLIKEILPHISGLNQLYSTKEYSNKEENQLHRSIIGAVANKPKIEDIERNITDLCTTSNHYCIVESEHPYRSATINSYRVEFPSCVQWFTIEFDSQCGTAQMEDYLLLSIPIKPYTIDPYGNDETCDQFDNNMCSSTCKNVSVVSSSYNRVQDEKDITKDLKNIDSDWIIIKKYNSRSNWFQNTLVLPGNRIEFSFETASLYAQDPHSNKFGFKCIVVGYDNPILDSPTNSCLIRLEYELAYLGGMCSANLMKKDLNLPDDKYIDDLSSVEETLANHSNVLSKGLAISDSALTINQALETILPVGFQSYERQFLKDFISGAPGSSGARLAAWLQPEPRLDPNKCQLNPIPEPVRYGWPTQLTVTIRDQYSDAVVVQDLKVEIKAIPAGALNNGNRKLGRISSMDTNLLSGVNQPPRINYEATIKEKMCFKAITFMKAYNPYSFEELRFCNPSQTRVTEILHAQDQDDGTFFVNWTPNSVGNYCLTVTVDGIQLEEIYRVVVKEGGVPPQKAVKKIPPPNRSRKFVMQNSAGLRIRSHPTLQSEQVGVIKLNGIITFIDEIENDDGVWVRLSTESIRQHCSSGWAFPTEAWSLQYNQHIDKTLLHPLLEPDTINTLNELKQNIENENANDENEPNQPQSPIKKDIDISLLKTTSPLPDDNVHQSTNPFIFPTSEVNVEPSQSENSKNEVEKSFSNQEDFALLQDNEGESHKVRHEIHQNDDSISIHSSSPSNISTAIAGVVGASKLQALQKWFKGDSSDGKENVRKKPELSETASVSVRDLVRAIGVHDVKSNGNSAQGSRSSSPVLIPAVKPVVDAQQSACSSSSKSTEISDTSMLISSLTRDLSRSPSQGSTREDSSSQKATDSSQSDPNVLANRGCNLPVAMSIGSSSILNTPKHTARKMRTKRTILPGNIIIRSRDGNFPVEEGILPNLDMKSTEQIILENNLHDQRTLSASTDTSSPPVWPPLAPNQFANRKLNEKDNNVMADTPKRAMPPSLAETLRAVFAALLWHEGIVHDAMACASFLKFHPSLPKEGAIVVTRRDDSDNKMNLSKEQKAQQRHSVEVANAGNYLNIRPSTLETLTKSGNSSINRRYRKGTNGGENDDSDKTKLQALPEVVAVLPPALRCLVYLWEQLCSNCLNAGHSSLSSSEQQKLGSSKDSSSKHKDDKDGRKIRRKKKDDGSWCELCEIFLPIPVTYHMRIVHPGCGRPALGKGYNSIGIYCEGWAGNCGDGGKGASSWFLMCDACRQKYVICTNKNVNNINHSVNIISPIDMNIFCQRSNSMIANSEIYNTLKENAIFLLELSSNSSNLLNNQQKRSPQPTMPVVVENTNPFTDIQNRPSTSRGDSYSNRNSRAFKTNHTHKTNGPFASTPHRKSISSAQLSPDWVPPNTFSCLESLGASVADDLPYDMLGTNTTEKRRERPLSDISFESFDPNNSELMTSSGTTHGTVITKFHRSYSMGQGWSLSPKSTGFITGGEMFQNLEDPQQNKVIMRRRNNSATADSADGSLLMCYPSDNLRKLVPENILSTSFVIPSVQTEELKKGHLDLNTLEAPSSASSSAGKESNNIRNQKGITRCVDLESCSSSSLLTRPAMAFIVQQHDLEKIRYIMKRSLRIATCRIYSLKALNWLIRSVTQSVCLHDLMWWFVTSLNTGNSEEMLLKNDEMGNLESALEHPVSFTQMSGKISHILSQSLHTYLQSVADLTLFLPAGSSLQRIAIQSFGIKFKQADHQFLHNSHVFGNISKILSKSDEQNEAMLVSSNTMADSNVLFDQNYGAVSNSLINPLPVNNSGAKLCNYYDLCGMFEIAVSSRPAMADSLIDNSTETFWESDEEDRNKCKIIEISMNKLNYVCKIIFVHIDNSRDIQNKVLNVVFFAGQSLGDTNLIKTVDIDSRACTWISAKIPDESYTHYRLEFRGPENTLRVRQIKLIGLPSNDCGVYQKLNLKLTNATQIQQRMCETETLRVFRLITAQVFGKLILTTDNMQNDDVSSNNYNPSSGMESSATSLLADSLDLREHMVGILFSRSKLSHLQKQVIVHIVHAIRKESIRAKEEWEISIAAITKDLNVNLSADPKSDSSTDRYRAPDTYCFEMLSMVLALSGSAVGRSYLSHQHGLLKDLLSLLHTGSDRVQRQVTALLRRILPVITPESLADLLGIQKLPSTDLNILCNQAASDFDMNRLGILDVFLAVIAKSLQLQVKIKATSTRNNINKIQSLQKLCTSIDFSVHQLKKKTDSDSVSFDIPPQFAFDSSIAGIKSTVDFDLHRKKPREIQTKNLNQRWFLKGVIPVKQAEAIITLIKDMAAGKLTEKWSLITKAAIAESILNLTRLDEVFRNPENCVKTSTLWLSLASLCVLDKDHVEKLSSGQWSKVSDTRPMCTNHDDGETPAIIQCEVCASLCGDCDRFLHLNRKTRNHRRTVCKEEEEAIRVELHESCGRTKLFWLLALTDSKTLKSIVEFRDGSCTILSNQQETVGRCRFCGVTENSGLLEIGNVCADPQCQENAANSCTKIKQCGHSCGGVIKEEKCLPCLQQVCQKKENDSKLYPRLTQDADDMCMICFVEALCCAPSIQLECGHVFHYHCGRAVLEKKWNGPRITFGFSLCPICKTDIQHPILSDILDSINSLKEDVKRKSIMRFKYEGLANVTENKDLTTMALDRYAYYVCFKCQKAYYGGEARCDAEIGEKFDPEELVCGGCSDVARAQMCPKHGTDYLEYKCRFCCSVAVFFCFGTTHFCDTCHDDFQRLTNIPKLKLPQCPVGPRATQLSGEECPLHIIHPPNGEEFALGCGICRNAQTF